MSDSLTPNPNPSLTPNPVADGQTTGGTFGATDGIGFEHPRAPLVDGAVHRLESGREWARQQTARAQDHVRAHPLRSTAYAVGAGVLAGMVMRTVRPRAR